MKYIYTITFLLFSAVASAQPGIKAGVNASYWSGTDATYSGTKHTTIGFVGGIYDKIRLSKRLSLTPELLYTHQGAKNPVEGNLHFDTYMVGLYIALGYNIGPLEIHAAPYCDRMVYARNSSKEDENSTLLQWNPNGWQYLNKFDLGSVVGVKYDLGGAYLDLSFKYGWGTIKGSEMPDTRCNGCHVAGGSITFAVPFKTFGE